MILAFTVITAGASALSFKLLNEAYSLRDFLEIQIGQLMLMVHISGICFGISAFMRRESLGLGIGLALLLYFFQLLIGLDAGIGALRYITPYYYTQAAGLVGAATFDRFFVTLGLGTALGAMLIGFVYYIRKDLKVS